MPEKLRNSQVVFWLVAEGWACAHSGACARTGAINGEAIQKYKPLILLNIFGNIKSGSEEYQKNSSEYLFSTF
jgi:hypothetical protein